MMKMKIGIGFRFHPTDEELVAYYLKRKTNGTLPIRFETIISQSHVYKSDPWDLTGFDVQSKGEVEWYFFSVLDTKHGNGSRTNRATPNGYWKTTGKDRPVYHNSNTIGMKKTLVFHSGRAPHGSRSNWVMHEYRLLQSLKDAFVLCRLFQKCATKAPCPFLEEDQWDNDIDEPTAPVEHVPGHASFQTHHLPQKVDMSITPENDPFLLDFCSGNNNNNCVEGSEQAIVNDQNQLVIGITEDNCAPELPHVNPAEADIQFNEPYFDAAGNFSFDGGLFLEADYNHEEYLSYFDADTGNLSFDLSKMIATESPVFGQGFCEQPVNGGTEHLALSNEQLKNACGDDGLSTSYEKKSQGTRLDSDIEYSSVKQRATLMLEGIPAPPAFASEFPSTKNAQIIQMRRNNMNRNGLDLSFGKNGTLDLILSFALSQEGDSNSTNFETLSSLLFGKTAAIPRGLLYLMFVGVLALSMSYKIL